MPPGSVRLADFWPPKLERARTCKLLAPYPPAEPAGAVSGSDGPNVHRNPCDQIWAYADSSRDDGFEERQIDAIAHRAPVDDAVPAALFDELAEVLARDIVDCRTLRQDRAGEFLPQPLKERDVAPQLAHFVFVTQGKG